MLIVLALVVRAERVYSQEEDGLRYLESLLKAYAGLSDYTCDVKIHFDLQGVDTPDMEARLYYKAPDKVKFDTKGLFFLPREGAVFNPAAFKPEDFDVILLDRLKPTHAVRLRLVPKKIKRALQGVILTIDTDQNLISEAVISEPGGRTVTARITYGRFGGFELPSRVRLRFDAPPPDSGEVKTPGPFERGERRLVGTVDIAYSDYKVNTGLSEELFKEKEPYPAR